ncbi:hypothetical protein CASFOL_039911 [Castilleja foliolosa]|uniref:Peptidase A1 domain-containing protein n=1 Tax=Castilleja foliolosa TaxID=1961234 RepID=A0ABD3BGI5_9LAMI
MTTLNCFIHLKMIFMLYSSFLLILISNFLEKSVALQSHFETVESAPECKRFIIDPNEMPKSTFEVFDMYGPCSPSTARTSPMNMPSPHDILHLDRLRVDALQARFKPNSTTNKNGSRFQDTKEVAHLPAKYLSGNYAITIGLGTPSQVQTLVFDTASDTTWSNGFHSYASSTFKIIPCVSSLCISLPQHTCETFDNVENTCFYNIRYMDGSYTKGAFATDILTVPQTSDVFLFDFGCATEVNSKFNSYANSNGVLGLGRQRFSFSSQTKQIYKGIFSYCFPSDQTLTGFLKLGPRDYPDNERFTPLITNTTYPSFYFINITSISVGHVALPINHFDFTSPKTFIDTGTVVSRLPSNVYTTMRDEFRRQMANYGYKFGQIPDILFDTCYDNSIDLNLIPTITFTFEGDVSVDMDSSATLFTFSASQISCLAFARNSEHGQPSIFGNIQQKKLEVVYDVAGGKLRFRPNGCN